MKILFDPAKRETNLVKHSGLDFADLDEAQAWIGRQLSEPRSFG